MVVEFVAVVAAGQGTFPYRRKPLVEVNFLLPVSSVKGVVMTLIPGAWYLMFVCRICKAKQVLFPDLSDGKSKIMGDYNVACQTCGHRDLYECENLERYQHPNGWHRREVFKGAD
jgi:DNA-directed RNA polymerase subunit RPC12/RpoP